MHPLEMENSPDLHSWYFLAQYTVHALQSGNSFSLFWQWSHPHSTLCNNNSLVGCAGDQRKCSHLSFTGFLFRVQVHSFSEDFEQIRILMRSHFQMKHTRLCATSASFQWKWYNLRNICITFIKLYDRGWNRFNEPAPKSNNPGLWFQEEKLAQNITSKRMRFNVWFGCYYEPHSSESSIFAFFLVLISILKRHYVRTFK